MTTARDVIAEILCELDALGKPDDIDREIADAFIAKLLAKPDSARLDLVVNLLPDGWKIVHGRPGEQDVPWRLIETAPKDGKPILCCFKGQFAWMFFVCAANGSNTSRVDYADPTHWFAFTPPSEDKT